ncbi:MAG: ABC transporter permease [Planctomycetota bacterium]|jgi:hypothetical protein
MHSIWAVATNTVKQALRMKVALVFIILLMVLLPVMGVSMVGDGTLKGRLQTFVSYGLSLTSLLLCMLTIAVSTYSLANDIKQRQIYTVITKPIRRWKLILGKLLGVLLLSTGLLVLFSAIIYAITVYTPKFHDASEAELAQVRNEFFTARASLIPAEPDVSAEVISTYNRLKERGQLEQWFRGRSRREILARLTMWKRLQKRAAEAGRELLWEFENVKPLGPEQSLFIRFKYDVSVNPPDLQVYSRWVVGDIRQLKYRARMETPIRSFERRDLIRTFHEIEVPADVVAEDGYLAIAFLNVPVNNTVVIFPLEDGLEVLYKADAFSANFIRAVLLILFRLVFLAVLGMLASTFLSFPVAILVCLVVFFTANFSGFVIDSFSYLSGDMNKIYSYTLGPIIRLLPRFDGFNPNQYLVFARLLSWSVLAKAGGFMICIKAVLLLVLALLVFRYREIARITV